MVKFVLNTTKHDAGTQVCIFDLHKRLIKEGYSAVLNDWDNYSEYDFAVFMAYDHEMAKARLKNQNLKIILVDPKLTSKKLISDARNADLLVVSSVEQRDAFLRLNTNCHIHHMFPTYEKLSKTHQNRDKIHLIYHGNRVHIDAMRDAVGAAIVKIAKDFTIEFSCIYNIKQLGHADLQYLSDAGVKVNHVQWSSENMIHQLNEADIGILPNELPIHNKSDALHFTTSDCNHYAFEPFDHLLRFKVSTNPGRIYPFVQAGLPVISDFCPSSSQFIKDGESGFIVSGVQGWCFALQKLCADSTLRQQYAEQLAKSVHQDYSMQVSKFVRACQNIELTSSLDPSFVSTVLKEQLKYDNYPRPQENLFRWCRRQLRRVARHL